MTKYNQFPSVCELPDNGTSVSVFSCNTNRADAWIDSIRITNTSSDTRHINVSLSGSSGSYPLIPVNMQLNAGNTVVWDQSMILAYGNAIVANADGDKVKVVVFGKDTNV